MHLHHQETHPPPGLCSFHSDLAVKGFYETFDANHMNPPPPPPERDAAGHEGGLGADNRDNTGADGRHEARWLVHCTEGMASTLQNGFVWGSVVSAWLFRKKSFELLYFTATKPTEVTVNAKYTANTERAGAADVWITWF